jgi:hypothetical protein
MNVTRLFTGANGISQFEDLNISLERDGVEQFANLCGSSAIILNETDAGHQYSWHNAPQKQWVITLQGEIEVQLRDGSTRKFGPGSIILAEDLTGSGHATKVTSSVPWRCAYLPFDGEIRA